MPPVQRSYGSRNRQNRITPSYPPSTLSSSPPPTPIERPSKRSFWEISPLKSKENFPPAKKLKGLPKISAKPSKITSSSKGKGAAKKGGQKTLTQLHFSLDQSILRTCPQCDLTYTKGAPDDEALHRSHCTRVQQGMEWGREEEKDSTRNGRSVVTEIKSDIPLKGGKKTGRIISFPTNIGGKIGSKLTTLLQTINIALSSPDLPQQVLQSSKAYLFLIPHESNSTRERIVGCVIAQRISTAMAIVPSPSKDSPDATTDLPLTATLVSVDPSTELFCDPTPLPTPMGIPRLFVSTTHRRLGIAQHLLRAAAETFIHGCPLDPTKGQVAFSQPTGMGQKVMKAWGQGGVRVYEE